MWRISFLFLLVLGLGGERLRADTLPYRHYTLHDGLPSKQITALAQTANGLLWIGTQNGLAVYDGHQIRPIPMPDSVRRHYVMTIQPMPDGSVWAGMGHDAVRVQPHGVTRTLPLGEHLHTEILRRGETTLFVTDQAVWTLAPDQETPTRTEFYYETLSNVTLVRGADLDPKGRLWIVNGRRGPGRVKENGTVVFSNLPSSPGGRGKGTGEFYDLQFIKGDTALVSRPPYLYRFDTDRRQFERAATRLPAGARIEHQGATAYVTQGTEVLRYNVRERRMMEPVGAGRDFPNGTTTAVLRGQEGGLWIGTRDGLLHFPAPETRHVREIGGTSFRAGTVFRAHDGAVWAHTWGQGLFQLRPRRKRSTPGGRTRWVFPRTHDDQLHALSAPGREWYRWTAADGWRSVGIAAEAVRGYVDSSGVGYFWHNDGLYRHVPAGDTTDSTRIYSWPVEVSQHHLMGPAPNGDLILFDQGIVLRLQRPDGGILDTIATVPEHETSQGRRLQVDSKGRIWCPFRGAGVLRVDPEEGTTQTLLKGTVVEAVIMAGDSLAMAKTNEGLYLMDAETGGVWQHLTESDGLLSNDVNGAHLTADTLYVGHKAGITLMPADSIFSFPPAPHTVVTGLEINHRERSMTADSSWSAEHRAVGFSYTAASLSHPDWIQYEARLLPRDTTWELIGRPFTRYTNLEPGSYQFEVRARLKDQSPGPKAAYSFTIAPYFYETWWFRLLVGLGVVGGAVTAYRWRVRWLERRRAELQHLVEERTRELAEEKKKTERQAKRLAELDEAKNRFFAHISHEFRTPLSLILSPLRDTLRRGGDAISFGQRQVRRMVRNAERLQRLIDQLLDLATLEAGRMELEPRVGDPAVLVGRTAEAFRSKAEQKNITLEVLSPSEPVETRFDPEKVETIVSNLVGNAVKFTPEGGRVTVRIERMKAPDRVEAPADTVPEGAVRIEVRDTGPGIDPDVHAQIFDRFEQSPQPLGAATQEHEGTGLGLALTRELVELHGGTIEVESTPGAGSVFTVWLPLIPVAESQGTGRVPTSEPGGDGRVAQSQAAEDEQPDPGTEAASGPGTILVVEDNDEMREYLREQLSEHWTVRVAADGDEGWRTARDHAPDLILSDVMMPGVDGFELCRRVKDDEQLRTTPVLLLTARAGTEPTVEGLKCGADDYVAKPFDVAELRQRITNHLAARRHLQDRYREEVEVGTVVVEAEEASFVEELIEVINEHLGNPDLTVGRLAEQMALSRRQFTRRVKQATGDPPATFLRKHRIEQAKALLAKNPKTIAEVAYAVGFQSPSSFSKSFREHVGCSPSAYVDRHAE